MQPRDYTVIRIDGDYAVLKEQMSGEEILVAMALLPDETDEGIKLHWEDMIYTVIG